MDTLLHTSGIKAYTVQHRVKDEGSLKDKIQLKNKYKTISDITDILGLRIITYYSSDTDLVEDIIKNEFAVDSENTIDKRKKDDPDRFGYMSLH
ncbi:RelA/SpoT domain-containing protein, partial [Klebsiella pneumoniae]|uniref:RelA/SpoT domain-containing protein n=1 Tax=Klebsiella pneumoniae TaxID=573 RepID=UPI00190F86E3